jgi:hypothetical protein
MNNTRTQSQKHNQPTFSPVANGLLQRKCACGGSAGLDGECQECRKKQLQRCSANGVQPTTVPPIVHEVLRSPGQPLDPNTRAFMESRFGHAFGQVRVHNDTKAEKSAKTVNAPGIYGGTKHYFWRDNMHQTQLADGGCAHEQPMLSSKEMQRYQPSISATIKPLSNGGYRIAVAPVIGAESDFLEHQADGVAEQVISSSSQLAHPVVDQKLQIDQKSSHGIQRSRFELPSPVPLCGRTLTHIDIEPPRARPLEPCLPPTVLVTRINIVGRDVTVPTPGRGPQVFNLHIGYYRDPTTGRLCAIVDDSKTCIAGRCQVLGCFPTLKEVLDAILEFLKKALEVIGIILLLILLALIGRWLLRPGPGLSPAPGPVIAAGGREAGETEETETEA